jgi:predicted RNase H-like HicB family nuclease
MKTIALIEKGKDGTFGIYTPDLKHTIIGEGHSVEEAKMDFENSVKEILASYTDETMPDELKDLEIQYKYDLSSLFDYLNFVNVTQFARKAGISSSLMRQYKTGRTYVSEKQIGKIEKTLHKIGHELTSIKLI